MQIYKIDNQSDIYNISKLLFFLKYQHTIYINDNNKNIYMFDDSTLLIYTDNIVEYINVNCIILSTKIYNNKNICGKLEEIANMNNINIKLSSINDIDSVIKSLIISPQKYNNPMINYYKPYIEMNLPILLYKIKKYNSSYNNLCMIFTYKFKQTSCHSLSIVLYNIIILRQNFLLINQNIFNNIIIN